MLMFTACNSKSNDTRPKFVFSIRPTPNTECSNENCVTICADGLFCTLNVVVQLYRQFKRVIAIIQKFM